MRPELRKSFFFPFFSFSYVFVLFYFFLSLCFFHIRRDVYRSANRFARFNRNHDEHTSMTNVRSNNRFRTDTFSRPFSDAMNVNNSLAASKSAAPSLPCYCHSPEHPLSSR